MRLPAELEGIVCVCVCAFLGLPICGFASWEVEFQPGCVRSRDSDEQTGERFLLEKKTPIVEGQRTALTVVQPGFGNSAVRIL